MSQPLCYCNSDKEYAACCKPYHDGALVPSAEALVRARFSAFCTQNYPYLVQTTHPDFRDDLTAEGIAENTAGVTWQGLEILECGLAPASEGVAPFPTVSFKVLYEYNDSLYEMAETSYFSEEDGVLYYMEGIAHRQDGYRRPLPKVGRNEPCPCASGKKYKKCCGQGA